MNPPVSPVPAVSASLPSSPSSQPATSGAAGPGAPPGAKLRKRLPGARAGAARTNPPPASPLPEPVKVLVVVNEDGYIEVFIKGENVKSKVVERRASLTDEAFDRSVGYAWEEVNFTKYRRHTAMVQPPIRKIEDLVRDVWELKRRYRVISLANVASLATIAQLCNASLLDVMETLTDVAQIKEYQRECERAEASASTSP